MRLTELEKMALDAELGKKMEELCAMGSASPYKIINEVIDYHRDTLNRQNVSASLNRICANMPEYVIDYYNGAFHFKKGKKLVRVYTFKKEGNRLYLDCYPNFYYDFITKTFSEPLDSFVNGKQIFYSSIMETLKYEWIFNYITDFSTATNITNLPKSFYETMPKGLYNEIKDKPEGLTAVFLYDYVLSLKYGKYLRMVKLLLDYGNLNMIDGFFSTICSPEDFYKMLKNGILSGEFLSRDMIYNNIRYFYEYREYMKMCGFVFDFNRGFLYNQEMLKNLVDANCDNVLSQQMQKLNFINGLQIEEFTVVVPQTQADKQAEGRMQHNCVGHYYDDSIIRGRNLIYFIRKTNDIKHSYITCRYNTEQKDTVESRKINNNGIYNARENAIIDKISQIIREGLVE